MNNINKFIGFWVLPLFFILAAYVLFFNAASLPASLILVIQYVSYCLFLIGMILGLRFNKSKVFFLCLILGVVQIYLSNDLFSLSISTHKFIGMFQMLTLLIPINIFFFSIFKERGMLTFWGVTKLVFLAIQLFLGLSILDSKSINIETLFSYRLLDYSLIGQGPMPQLSLFLFLLVLLFLSVPLFIKPTLMDSSLIGAAALTFTGLLFKEHFLGIPIFFAMAGLILIIAVVETSHFMAYRDELTGLPARRALKESMLKLGNKYSIAMLDIDFFKKFNDTYGHDAGDEVLQMVATALTRVGGGGKAYRFGGEEFTILFPSKAKDEAAGHLEALRESIEKERFTYRKKSKVKGKEKIVSKQLNVTISIGVAEKNDKFKEADEVLQAADKALYKAKKNGRNCVCK